jgi:SAM-dependent methyltransferase
MLARARELADAEGLRNIDLVQGDAQVHPFPSAHFDVAMGRFSVMFFGDKKEGFTNIAHALRPGGRLVLLAWQSAADNEQFRTISGAVAAGRSMPTPPPGAPSPFGLADESMGREWLAAAGFVDITYESLHRPFNPAATAEEAYAFFSRSPMVTGPLTDLDDERRQSALDALREAFRAHETADGVVFDSAVWLITARIPAH